MTRTNTSDRSWTLPAGALPDLLAALAATCELWTPRPVGGGTRFLPHGEDRPLDLAQTPPAHSVKAVLFPNPETLFTYHSEGNGVALTHPEPDGRSLIVFGARACDARAVAALDAVFLGRSIPDPAYRERRERLCLVGLACVPPAATCFCHRMGSGPFDASGMDVQIVPLDDVYVFHLLTKRGEACLTPFQDRFEAADGDTLKKVAATKAGLEGAEPSVDFTALKDAVKQHRDDPYWETLAAACLGCGICTFLCPVCSCFSITDTGNRRGGRRVRYWDACMFPAFTKEASGHNPRGDEPARVKQRFFHKFYYSIENGEPPGCVGCGRCVIHCPAGIDIREIVSRFQPEAAS